MNIFHHNTRVSVLSQTTSVKTKNDRQITSYCVNNASVIHNLAVFTPVKLNKRFISPSLISVFTIHAMAVKSHLLNVTLDFRSGSVTGMT